MIRSLLNDYRDNPEAQDLIRLITYSSDSVFLTGKAGTGKSTLLRRLTSVISKNYIILAPTGIAALNVGGQTIHSFFQLEPRPYLPKDKDLKILKKKAKLLSKLDLIIIDEISMVRADLMRAIDLALRKNMKSKRAFGGKQLLMIGDLFQLPPVVDSRRQNEVDILEQNYHSPYFFSSGSFVGQSDFHVIELQEVYRQNDPTFIDVLNGIREGSYSGHHLKTLNRRYVPSFSPDDESQEIILATTNKVVDQTNQKQLENLRGREVEFHAKVSGSFESISSSTRLPAPISLKLKVGTRIMFIKNDPDKRWVNGSLGKVENIYSSTVEVKIDNYPESVILEQDIWEDIEYKWNKDKERIEQIVKGTFTQFPIKLAWAVTIHKSQGKTFEKVVIDLGRGAFATGQTYVALSRCTSLEGIKLKTRVNPSDIKVDNRIIKFLDKKNQANMERNEFNAIIKGLEKAAEEKTELSQKLKEATSEITTRDKQISRLNGSLSSLEYEMRRTQRRLRIQSYILAGLGVLSLGLSIVLIFMNI